MHGRLTIAVERATADDAYALMIVQDLAFADDLARYGECPSCLQDRDLMLFNISNSIYYKLVSNAEIVGEIELRKRSESHYHIHKLCVRPDRQDCGIGSQALDFVLNAHPEVTCWTLVTPVGNQRSRHLYEKHGFVVTGQIVHSPLLTLVRYERGTSKPAH